MALRDAEFFLSCRSLTLAGGAVLVGALACTSGSRAIQLRRQADLQLAPIEDELFKVEGKEEDHPQLFEKLTDVQALCTEAMKAAQDPWDFNSARGCGCNVAIAADRHFLRGEPTSPKICEGAGAAQDALDSLRGEPPGNWKSRWTGKAWFLVGYGHFRHGRYSAAVEAFEKALSIGGELGWKKEKAELFLGRARTHHAETAKNLRDTHLKLCGTIKGLGTHTKQLPEPARTLLVEGEELAKSGDYGAALAKFKAFRVEYEPDYNPPRLWFNQALVQAASGEQVFAITSMECYLVLAPDAANAAEARTKIAQWRAALPEYLQSVVRP